MEETGATKSPAQPDEQSRKHEGQEVGGAGKRRRTRCRCPWLGGPEVGTRVEGRQCHGKTQGARIRMRSRARPAGGVRGLAGSEAVVREWDRGEKLEMPGDDRAGQWAAAAQWR